jgi:hypothetical protein
MRCLQVRDIFAPPCDPEAGHEAALLTAFANRLDPDSEIGNAVHLERRRLNHSLKQVRNPLQLPARHSEQGPEILDTGFLSPYVLEIDAL